MENLSGTQKILSDLNTDQQEAVSTTEGPVLILAGAGSGKTRVLTYKVAYLIAKGIEPENILCVTFTNKAASEMKERVIRLLGNRETESSIIENKSSTTKKPNNLPYVGTFHAFCAKLLRIDGKSIGIPAGYLIYDDNDSLSLIKKIMKDKDISPKRFKPSSILAAISSAKSELLTPTEYAQSAYGPFAETVSDIYQIYQKELQKQSVCDFDDLLFLTVKLFESNPDILLKYSRRFKYVLVDEYQDVNSAQYILTKKLASYHANLTVVGDASQAIYSFRGADFRNILNFKKDFPDVCIFNLEQNYRSTQNILSAANAVISHNTSHPILNLWTKNSTGDKINLYCAQNEIDEANFIAETILSSGKSYDSFAVLYRTNAQSRTVEEAFLHSNIPYKLYGGVRFYERKEIKDILAYLRQVVNSKDQISKARIEKLGKGRLKQFDQFLNNLQKNGKSRLKPIELIDKILEITNYLSLIDDGSEQGLMRVENVKELKSVAADFEDLSLFLESVALMEGKTTPDKSYDKNTSSSVNLMTLHAAKGLEFDNVFVIGMEEGLFPHSRSMLDPSQMEEERRLAYVGMTRPKEKLYLIYTSRRLYFGTTSTNLISRFILDIPQELITQI